MEIESIRNTFLTVLGVLMLLVGITGNSLVAAAVWRKRTLRSTTNYLLVNIAIADIASLLYSPLMLVGMYTKLPKGILSDFLCKFLISFNVLLTASFASILTLVVLSVERYHAVVKPLKTGIRLRQETVKYAIVAVWLGATLLTLPLYIFGSYRQFGNKMLCDYDLEEKYKTAYALPLLVIILFIPFSVINFCYFRIVRELYFKTKVAPTQNTSVEDFANKRKLVKLSLSVTVTFMLCSFPLALFLILKSCDKEKFERKLARTCTSVLYVLQLVLNPFLYAFQSTNFRQAFKEMLKVSFGCKNIAFS